MKKNLRIWYDKEGDFLEVTIGKPVKGYYDSLGKECFVRRNQRTGQVIGFAIAGFSKQFGKRHRELSIPMDVILKPVKA
jgi:hypothetical protein